MNTPFEKRICYTICICQMTAVLSCVSIVYLSVAVYTPSYRTLQSGFVEVPAMCTTVQKDTPSCEPDDEEKKRLEHNGTAVWSSCGEWCLSKSSGFCTQLRVDVRNNGSNLRLEDCQAPDVKYCDGVNNKKEAKSCIEGQCADLHGIYNCSKSPPGPGGIPAGGTAMCRNLTSVLLCTLTTTDSPKECNTKAGCKDLEGLYTCKYGICEKILPPYKCEKRCVSIRTALKNVLIRQNDVIFTVNCGRAVSADTNKEVWPLAKKSLETSEPPFLILFCTNVLEVPEDTTKLHLMDCSNGTLLEPGHFGNYTNITHILNSHLESTTNPTRLMDPSGVYAPLEQNLIIYSRWKLYINFEGCVNTLMGECDKFHTDYGNDGKDMRSQSRFQCFFTPNDTREEEERFVVLRFSRSRTVMELLLATCVPITLAIVSCSTLVICSRIIHVGDDSHLTFQCCGDNTQNDMMEKEVPGAMAL